MMKLKDQDFLKIIELTPLVSIDLILINRMKQVLVGKRNNRPAKGYWFVPGGRILKNETIAKAFSRISLNETGLSLQFDQATLLGAYDHIYQDNYKGVDHINTHYVVLGYEYHLGDEDDDIIADDQHMMTKWLSIGQLMLDKQVHENTKRYFK